MKYICLFINTAIGIVIGVLATLWISDLNWFETPDDQGIIYAFQPIIATCGGIFAAFMAYKSTTHKAKNELDNRSKYYKTMLNCIEEDLDLINDSIQKVITNQEIIFTLMHLVEQYDLDMFNYEFVSGFDTSVIEQANNIQFSLDGMSHNIKDMYQRAKDDPKAFKKYVTEDIKHIENDTDYIKKCISKSYPKT